MQKKTERTKIVNILYAIAIFAVLLSCFFSNKLSQILYLRPDYKFNNDTEIHFIDVGQGDAIAIKFDSGKTMLIDTGPIEYQNKLKNYLDNIILDGSKKIDYLVLTHIDIDHSGNMMFILDNYDIGTFYRPKIHSSYESAISYNTSDLFDEIISKCFDKNIDMIYNESGVVLSVGFTTLTWLSPINVEFEDVLMSNRFSPMIRIEYNNHSALLTGDTTSDDESMIANSLPLNMLDVDILKIAHHGSNTSTSSDFISLTTPTYACISVGENTYGHPSNKLLERILDYDKYSGSTLYSNIYTTQDSGNVIFTLSSDIEVTTISNVDDYSFTSYFLYAVILIFVLILFMIKPYYLIWKKNIRFIIQNKKFKKYLEKEQEKSSP